MPGDGPPRPFVLKQSTFGPDFDPAPVHDLLYEPTQTLRTRLAGAATNPFGQAATGNAGLRSDDDRLHLDWQADAAFLQQGVDAVAEAAQSPETFKLAARETLRFGTTQNNVCDFVGRWLNTGPATVLPGWQAYGSMESGRQLCSTGVLLTAGLIGTANVLTGQEDWVNGNRTLGGVWKKTLVNEVAAGIINSASWLATAPGFSSWGFSPYGAGYERTLRVAVTEFAIANASRIVEAGVGTVFGIDGVNQYANDGTAPVLAGSLSTLVGGYTCVNSNTSLAVGLGALPPWQYRSLCWAANRIDGGLIRAEVRDELAGRPAPEPTPAAVFPATAIDAWKSVRLEAPPLVNIRFDAPE